MATLVNVTPASQVATVEVNNRQLDVVVNKGSKSIDVVLEPRGNIAVDISRAVSYTGVQNIIGGDDISVSNVAGNVTINFTPNGFTSTGNITAPNFFGNVVGNIIGNVIVPGANTDVLYNDNGNIGANSNIQFNSTTSTLTVNGNINAGNIAGNGSNLTNINGSNVTGTVPSSNITNHVRLGTGQALTINYTGETGQPQYLFGVTNPAFNMVANVYNPSNFSVNTANTATTATTAGTVTTNSQPNITSVGTLTGLSISGNITGNLIPSSNISYNLGNSSYRWNDLYLAGNTIYLGNIELSDVNGQLSIPGGNISGNLQVSGNANITSDLNVTGNGVINGNFTVNGNTYYTNVETLIVEDPIIEQGGGPNGAPLTSNDGKDRGSLLHYYTTQPVDAFMGWSNANGQFIFGSNVTNTSEVISVNTYGNIRANHILATIDGANIVGAVANANIANIAYSVAVGNVSGIGNIATINLDGSSSNVLYGNGVFAPSGGVTANYAAYAGNVTINAQPNITSVGTLTGLTVNGNATVGNLISIDSIGFDIANAPATVGVGQIGWDDADGTVQIGLKGGNVTLQIGEEQVLYARNLSGSDLTDGQIVRVSGASGNRLTVGLALADNDANSASTIGMVTESILNNNPGFITTSGTVHGLNTFGLTEGATVYLSATTPGGWTTTKPVAPAHTIILGWIERAHATLGSIYIKVDNGYELEELHNVLITSPAAGQALVYNSSNLWVNGNAAYSNTAGTVTTAAQPNITSVGTLTSLSVTGNISGANLTGNHYGNGSALSNITGSNVTGTVANATYATTSGSATTAGTVTTNAQPNITSLGTLSSLTVSGLITAVGTGVKTANIYDTTGVRTITTGYGAVVGAVGITGNLTVGTGGAGNLTMEGNIVLGNGSNTYNITASSGNIQFNTGNLTLGPVANLKITGGTTGQVLTTDGAGNLSFTTVSGGGGTPGGSNTYVQFNNGGSFGGVAEFTFNVASNTLTATNISGNGAGITNVAALTATTATTAGTITTNSQPNITSTGTLTSLNVSGVSNLNNVSNVIITGGSANYVLSTNGSGNLSWVAQTGGGGSTTTDFTPSFLLGGM